MNGKTKSAKGSDKVDVEITADTGREAGSPALPARVAPPVAPGVDGLTGRPSRIVSSVSGSEPPDGPSFMPPTIKPGRGVGFTFWRRPANSDLVLIGCVGLAWYLMSAGASPPDASGAPVGSGSGDSWLWRWLSVELPGYLWRRSGDGSLKAGVLTVGLINTVKISFCSAILALLVGFLLALCRIAQRPALRMLAQTYVELVRNLPPLVFLFILHFFFTMQILPRLAELSWLSWLPLEQPMVLNFISATFALGLYEAPYVAEILRGGIMAVPKEQWQAAASLGFPWHRRLYEVIMPQALRHSLPALTGQMISLVKDSAVLSAISVQELSFQGAERMATTYMTQEIWLTITLLYLGLNFMLSALGRKLEHSFKWSF